MSMIQLSNTIIENFDELDIPAPENPLYSPPKRKLKRLKKAEFNYLPKRLQTHEIITNSSISPISPGFNEPSEVRIGFSDAMENETVGKEVGPVSEFDPLGGDGLEKEKNVKRKLSLEHGDEDLNMKKKKKEKSMKPKESIRERKRVEKERKEELEHLHAESQRLLRETRDASFKPVQLIQKPISSVLDKIRLRKLEILKSCNIISSVVDVDCAVGNDIKETVMNANKVVDVDSNGTVKNPSNYAQADKIDVQLSGVVDNLLNTREVSPPSSQPTSNLKVDNVGDDNGGNDDDDASSSDYEVSSSEEENDKENISPSLFNVVNKDSSPKGDLAKAFLDDEAEEEDDSDCDLLRFQENEEENESDEHEELEDLIATAYQEAPIDQEKRKQLHQKWLELQDAAETDNVLQRLKSGHQGIGKRALNHDDYDKYDESDNDDEGNDGDDEVLNKNHSNDTTRQNLKKAKQMISRMFTDANDVYVPSDDEETEKNIFRHHILKHNEEPSLISPVEDESSREFFSLIKKLNIAPTTKKRGKVSAPLLDSLVLSVGNSSSSKSSFLNRTSTSLPSSHRQGSISVKTFIFGRDDSNSRTNISASEINSEKAEKENISAMNSKKNKMSSEVKSSIAIKRKMQSDSEASAGSSLFDILKQSSIKFNKQLENSQSASGSTVISESQVDYKFSAFKLRRNSKMGSRA